MKEYLLISKVINYITLLIAFALRSQVVSTEKNTRYGFKIKYILLIILFGFTPILGFLIGFIILVASITEAYYSLSKQNSRLILFLCDNKLIHFLKKIIILINKPIGCNKKEKQ